MRRSRLNTEVKVSPAWVSFADLFSQLMFIGIIIAVVAGALYLKKNAELKQTTAQNTELTSENERLAKENERLNDHIKGITASKLSLTGRVLCPENETLSKLQFAVDDQHYKVRDDGYFMIDEMTPGEHLAILSGKDRKEKVFRFSITPGGFHGYNVYPGELTCIIGDGPGGGFPEGLVIKEITEEYMEFGKGKFEITPKGQKFLIDQFSTVDSTGSSPIDRLKADRQLKIFVIGQADPDPVHDDMMYSNVGLSALRASTVADFITKDLGVLREQVIVMGLGDAASWLPPIPLSENYDKKEYYKKCRRVLIMYSENSENTLLSKIRNLGLHSDVLE